ncbi:DUF3180 domain-containing protein [Pseudolysinimonas sp.]|uniref:DUF3180 domain-containing protein n=1 Tax=Pseudolysinimonas sp. TaxID=2680009 RepID=UPI003F7F6AB3
MRQTNPALLLALAVFGGAVGFGAQTVLATMGMAKIRPEYTLALSLAIIAVLVVLLAVPVRRAVRGRLGRRIDPFYATRVVLLAKACSIAGALLGGAAIGLLADLLLRSASNGDTLARILVCLAGAIVLLTGGLVAEFLCRVPPPDDDDRHDGDPERVRS